MTAEQRKWYLAGANDMEAGRLVTKNPITEYQRGYRAGHWEGLHEPREAEAKLAEADHWAGKEAAFRHLEQRLAEAEKERDELKTALRRLVALKDGPRDEDYERCKPLAWDQARLLSGDE